MKYVDLPNLALVTSNHFDLRVDCARAISNVEIQASRAASGKDSATQLRDFFLACANAADKAAGGTGTIAATTS
ncbi:MAG: hypothetical protein GAK35_02204 [Herbaspirillum frisingense]|uniref:Uncharacterized protein n=1 Tax=Herbaspirillum frisingense TaxID=92645 RepID=A0A7V8JU02_9BURK|nr:MAG: hypothetical protein GAK35_02204 [Herbaspirillum frisingense]